MSTIVRVFALVPVLAFAVAEEVNPAPAPAPVPTATDGKAPAEVDAKPAKAAKAPRPAKAHDPDINNIDVRVLVGSAGGVGKVRDDDLKVESNDFTDKSGGRFSVQVQFLRARPGWIGFVVGGGLFAASHEGTMGGVKSTVGAAGLDLKGGFVWRPTRNLHFELPSLVLSGGSASVKTVGAADSKDGSYSAIALQVGGFYTFNSHFQIGLELGGQGFKAIVERDIGAGVKHDIIYSGGGGVINLAAGWRF